MTDKELFTEMMKQNVSLPTELSSREVLETSRRRAYVRTPFLRYVAVAVIASAVTAAGVYFAMRGKNSINTADDISASYSQSAESSQSDSSKAPVSPDSRTLEKMHTLLNDIIERGGLGYRTLLVRQTMKGGSDNSETKYLEYPSVADSETSAARWLLNAKLEAVSEYYAKPYFENMGLDRISVQGANGSFSYLYKDGETWVIFILPNDEPDGPVSAWHYFKTSGVVPPLYENGSPAKQLGSWQRDHVDMDCRKDHDVPLAEKSRTVTISDAEDRISIQLTSEQGEKLPQVRIDSIDLPEGVTVTDSEIVLFTIPADSDSSSVRGYTLDDGLLTFDSIADELKNEELTNVNVEINFSTTEHPGSEGCRYPYSINISFSIC